MDQGMIRKVEAVAQNGCLVEVMAQVYYINYVKKVMDQHQRVVSSGHQLYPKLLLPVPADADVVTHSSLLQDAGLDSECMTHNVGGITDRAIKFKIDVLTDGSMPTVTFGYSMPAVVQNLRDLKGKGNAEMPDYHVQVTKFVESLNRLINRKQLAAEAFVFHTYDEESLRDEIRNRVRNTAREEVGLSLVLPLVFGYLLPIKEQDVIRKFRGSTYDKKVPKMLELVLDVECNEDLVCDLGSCPHIKKIRTFESTAQVERGEPKRATMFAISAHGQTFHALLEIPSVLTTMRCLEDSLATDAGVFADQLRAVLSSMGLEADFHVLRYTGDKDGVAKFLAGKCQELLQSGQGALVRMETD